MDNILIETSVVLLVQVDVKLVPVHQLVLHVFKMVFLYLMDYVKLFVEMDLLLLVNNVMIETLSVEMVVPQPVEFNNSISVQEFLQSVLTMVQPFVVIEKLKLVKLVMMETLLMVMDVMINVKLNLPQIIMEHQQDYPYLVKSQQT